ncbi:hypothetical protein [Candidatus Spongiihabitans sp.]|uniref:hypothetical protein n=1 Tax=Candidatus Spongiihabitans sp. TaxID=3101308 RepID=UPI003C6FF010
MSESKSHKTTANRIASKFHAGYNKGKGADIQTRDIAVEVETHETVSDAPRQLQGHKKPVYIAGTNQEAVSKALEKTEGTTIGVMDNQGNVIKESTRW